MEFCIDINKFFASHTLIVGNTGSGKSNTLNTIYTELYETVETRGSYFLFIDTNGEYGSAFTNRKGVKDLNTHDANLNTLKLPIQLLESEDWKLLLEATEKTQYPIIKTAWNGVVKNVFSREIKIEEYIVDELKKTIVGILNSNSNASNRLGAINSIREDISFMQDSYYKDIIKIFDPFELIIVNNSRLVIGDGNVFEDRTPVLIESVKSFKHSVKKDEFNINDFGLILNMLHLFRTYKYNTNENNTSPLIARFNSNKRDFNNIFLPYQETHSLTNVIDVLFNEKRILVCNVSRAKKDVRRIIVTFLCAKLYHFFCKKKNQNTSLHLIVDEAHNYLSTQNIDKEDAIAKTCIETFESIIKEGRKFGVFLTMATQRPSDITATLLSQSHNYVIHKLVNPRDIEIIKNTVPFIDDMSMKMLSVLAPGQAIFSGTAFNRPNIVQVKFDEVVTRVESDTVQLMDEWRRREIFSKEALMKMREEADYRKGLAELGISDAIAVQGINCWNCGEEYICSDDKYAPLGICLNCGNANYILYCSSCGCRIESIESEDNDKKYCCDFCRSVGFDDE